MPETKPKETLHQQKSHMTVKPVPPTPMPASRPLDMEALMINLYRGHPLDLKKLSAHDKVLLASLLDKDTKAEIVHKYPDREKIRENARKALL